MTTPLQHKIYLYIQQFIGERGFAPSLEEVAVGIGISPRSKSLISRCVHSLKEQGKLILREKGYRNIAIPEPEGLVLPLLGSIAAGSPIEAIEQPENLDLGAILAGKNNYVLSVKGNSMIEEGILDGDKVICKQQNNAQEGDIVVALIDQRDATLKRISYKLKGMITLIPANPQFKAKAYSPQRIQIQGVFIGLLRLHKKERLN